MGTASFPAHAAVPASHCRAAAGARARGEGCRWHIHHPGEQGLGGVVRGELKSNNKSSNDNALGLGKGQGGGGRDGLDMSIVAGTSLGSCWDGDSGTVTINA